MKFLVTHTRKESVIHEIADTDWRVVPWFSYQTVYDHRWQAEARQRHHLSKIVSGQIP